MSEIKPWAVGSFEMLYHAETHFLIGEDFDRRIALISFDNAIEVSITTYLGLHPIQRGGKEYPNEDVEKWQKNYHSKLEFFYGELQRRSLTVETDKANVIHYHKQRGDQYHGGTPGVPEIHILEGIRRTSIWVFGVLFEIPDAKKILKERLEADRRINNQPIREIDKDRLIDKNYEMVEIAGIPCYPSEILFHVDYEAYKEIGDELASENGVEPDEENREIDNE